MYSYFSIINQHVSNKTLIYNDKNAEKINYTFLITSLWKEIYNCNVNRQVTQSEMNKQMVSGILYNFIVNLYFHLLQDNVDYIKMSKYKILFLSNVLDNIFYNDEIKDSFFSMYSKIQKTYFALSKFVRLCKYKKAVIQISCDLYMNELSEHHPNVFVLFQNNCKYLFSASDLVNIINNNLTNSYLFFSEPIYPKNPYNNLVFDKATLYNIYFFMKSRPFIMPVLFQQFFTVHFDVEIFKQDNEQFIREESIKRYVYSTSPNVLYNTVMTMIENLKLNNSRYKILCIHKEFPKTKLVEIMRPYLHLYYLSKFYIVGTEKITNSYEKLIQKFDLFIRYNPLFGRKIMTRSSNGLITTFNEEHMNFYKIYDTNVFKTLPKIENLNGNSYPDEIIENYEYEYIQNNENDENSENENEMNVHANESSGDEDETSEDDDENVYTTDNEYDYN